MFTVMKKISPQKSLKIKRNTVKNNINVFVWQTHTSPKSGKFSSDIKEKLFWGFQNTTSKRRNEETKLKYVYY